MRAEKNNFSVEKIFPLLIRERMNDTDWQKGLEEIRVRVGQPMEFFYDTGSRCLVTEHGTCTFVDSTECRRAVGEPYRATMQDIAEMLSYISNYSLYAYKEELKQGYITIEGGHRVGMAGGAVMENGKIAGLHHISFLNIRIAHERYGCAEKLLPYIRHENSIHNTLFLSEPGAGKTTLLRDCIRILSEGTGEYPGMKVCVVDERSEIAACHLGIPQNDLGPRTDVLDGCGKPEGMQLLLRSMSPQVLAVDELGGEGDYRAVEQAVYSGSRVLGTVHAGNIRDLAEKPYLHRWVRKEMFKRYILIERERDGNRKLQVFDAHMEKIC